MKKILIAVPKGRILQELDKIFKVLSLLPEQDFYNENSRKIIFNADLKISEKQNIAVELIKVRSFDVANFVNVKGEIFSFNPHHKHSDISLMIEDN